MSRRKSVDRPDAPAAASRRGRAELSSPIQPYFWILMAVIAVVAAAAYWPATGFQFVNWDDNENVTENPFYQPSPAEHYEELWTVPYYAAYIPITRLVWASLSDEGATKTTFDPVKYHTVNIVFHAANAVLVFLLLSVLLGAAGASGKADDQARAEVDANGVHAPPTIHAAAVVGALIFAVHPLQVEPVAWVTGLKDILCGFFSFLALYLYIGFALETNGLKAIATASKIRLGAASFAYLLAVLSKSSAVVLPIIALWLDWLVTSTPATDDTPLLKRFVARVTPVRLTTLGFWLLPGLGVTLATKSAEDAAGIRIPMVGLFQRIFLAADTYVFYLAKVIFPAKLGPDYGRTPTWLMAHGGDYPAILAPIALVAVMVFARRRAMWAAAAAGTFLITILPVSGIVPFDYQQYSTEADRYMYFAMFAIALAAGGALSYLPPSATGVVGVMAAAALIVGTERQLPVWRNTTTLFTQGLRVNPKSWTSIDSLGHELDTASDGLAAKGDMAGAAAKLDAAIADYRKSLALKGDSEITLSNLGQALGKKATKSQPYDTVMLEQARQYLEQSVKIRENYPEGHSDLGNVYYAEGRTDDALAQYKDALKYDPDNAADLFMVWVTDKDPADATDCQADLKKSADEGYQQAIDHLNSAPASP